MRNFCNNKIQWVWTMRKLNTPISVSTYLAGSKNGQKAFGYPIHISSTWYNNGDIYFDNQEINIIKDFLHYKTIEDPKYPDIIERKIFSLSKKIEKQSICSLESLTLRQLIAKLRKEQRYFFELIGFISYRGSVQMADILKEKVETILTYRLAKKKKLTQLNSYIDQISYPKHESIIAKEKKYTLKLADNFNQDSRKEQERKINQYLLKYSWLSYHWFVGSPPSKRDIARRLSKFSSSSKKEIKKIEKEKNNNKIRLVSVEKSLDLNTNEKQVIRQFRTWLFLRTFVKDNINKAGYKILPILTAIAEHLDIEPRMITFLTFEEIYNISSISPAKLRHLIKKRRKSFSGGNN